MFVYRRKILLAILDISLLNLATCLALIIRFDGKAPSQYIGVFINSFLFLTIVKVFTFYVSGLYRSLWQYASFNELIKIFMAVSISEFICYFLSFFSGWKYPRSVYIIEWLLTLMFIGAIRFCYRLVRKLLRTGLTRKDDVKKVMIIGAGEAGSMVIKELKNHPELEKGPVAVIDDDKRKFMSNINGIPVKGGREKIKEFAEEMQIDEIIVAIPSAPKPEISSILKICKETKCKLMMLPGVFEIINGKVSINNIREVNIDDLLGRDEVKLNTEEIAGYLKNEVILVTGGGGSIGSELCRQIARFEPKKLIIFDIYENNAYDLQNELLHTYKGKLSLEVLIGSVRDKKRLSEVFERYRPGVVFHAAAHKHVPLMEMNPAEAIKNNVFGTLYSAQCADQYGAKKFVLISTDKAVNPTNIMGATKRLAEMIVQSIDKHSHTEFAAVRFGNVLGSNGSVIPLFKKQIAQGGPVTVTHPDVIRYFMTIPEAAQLVIQAGAMAKGGEVFVLDMGEPVRILELARDLIRLSGFEPDVDIKIEFTGLRPGEKLYEELLMAEEGIRKTGHEKIYVGKPLEFSFNEVLMCIKALENSMEDQRAIRECMGKVVPTYNCVYKELAVGMQE